MVAVGGDHMGRAAGLAWFPVLSRTFVVLLLNRLGDGLRDLPDTRSLDEGRYEQCSSREAVT